MQSNKRLMITRLNKEETHMAKEPIPNVLVKREGLLNFYFVIYGLDAPYKGGYYYGLLELHENYPFAAPKLFFYTPNGRFEINMAICTSFTHYHQESWTSAWNVRSLILGTISFMTSEECTYGCRNDSNEVRSQLALKSLKSNLKDERFCKLFSEDLKKIGVSLLEKTAITQKLVQKFQQKSQDLAPAPLQNDPQNQLLPRRNQQPQSLRKKLLIAFSVAALAGLSLYLILH